MGAAEEEHPPALGPWVDADLNQTARRNVGVGTDTDLPAHIRFLAGVAKLVRRRMATQSDDPVRPAIFLLESAARLHKPEVKPRRIPMLDNGLTVVTGRLWLVNAPVVSGSYVELEDSDDEELFTTVTTQLKLGNVPAIIFDPRTKVPTLRFYPKGLGEPDSVEELSTSAAEVNLKRIFEVVERVHFTCFVTPEVQAPGAKLWERGDKCWPSKKAEHLIQAQLRAGLTTAFPTCTVRLEQTIVSGRLDLEVEQSDALDRSNVTRFAVLELKVLRSFRSSGVTVSPKEILGGVESGVKQAASYGADRGVREAGLCCFDMRSEHTGEQCFDHVRVLAKELTVELRVWFIFGTSEQYRDFITTTQIR